MDLVYINIIYAMQTIPQQHEECLREVLVELMELDPDKINLHQLYATANREVKEYIENDGDTASREDLVNVIAKVLTGKTWPIYADTNEYKMKFQETLRPYMLDPTRNLF